jgi:hypothetical protein
MGASIDNCSSAITATFHIFPLSSSAAIKYHDLIASCLARTSSAAALF